MTFRQKSIHQMRAEKTRPASDDGNRLGTFCGHCAFLLMVTARICQKEVREMTNDEFSNDDVLIPKGN